MKTPIQTLIEKNNEIIAPWPNTYTFTKSLAERALEINRGKVPLVLLRPSIIIAANNEPYPGWIDAMTAASPITLMISLGLLRYANISKETRADHIPVDYVSNSIIISTAH
jgi:fatty acyl-CoA reductase